MLHNESYIGRWRYKVKEWRKRPGTNKRQPSVRPESEVILQERPHLRIVDEETWTAAQGRLRSVRAHYTTTKDGKPKGRSLPGRATRHLFSSLLFCAVCGSKMVVSGGSGGHVYYRCEGHTKRGICENALSVREAVVRASLLDELRHRLLASDGIAHARKAVAEQLGELSRERGSETREARARLDKVQSQIDKVVDFIADGNVTSTMAKSVAEKLGGLEHEAEQARRALKALERTGATPIKLPTPEEMLGVVFDLERRLLADVTRGREELRRLFRDGRIDLMPQPGKFYVAKSQILPLVLLTKPPPEENLGGRYTASGCAGRI